MYFDNAAYSCTYVQMIVAHLKVKELDARYENEKRYNDDLSYYETRHRRQKVWVCV